jgi:hypothetical protein
MKYALEKRSGAMIHIQDFIKIGLGLRRLRGWIQRHTDSIVIS